MVARLRAAGCVFAEDEAALLIAAAVDAAELEAMVARRAAGLPLEQVVGWAEFCGLRIAVAPGVFVPRHRTELMVREAVARLRPGDLLVDLCCGSGAVAAAVSAQVHDLVIHAVDIDEAAVACARRNLAGTEAQVCRGDLDAPLPAERRGAVAVITANVPYVPTADVALLPREARDHEPLNALDGGADGLSIARRVAALAPQWLRRGGHLLIEVADAQTAALSSVFAEVGLQPRVVHDDGLETNVVVGTRD